MTCALLLPASDGCIPQSCALCFLGVCYLPYCDETWSRLRQIPVSGAPDGLHDLSTFTSAFIAF